MAQVTRQSWAASLLQALKLQTTNANLQIIVGWELAEGGNWNNTAAFNPLNTTQSLGGSTSVNSVGVQAFKSWQDGLTATVKTLNNGNYASILAMLQGGNTDPETAATTINSSPWGTKDLTAALIQGSGVTPNDAGQTISAGNTGGGTFGAGGTGTPANQTSLWTVGDAHNPDQDYYTTINQYGQNAQWYTFSDGETLIVADGIRLMGQRPQAVISRTDPAVIQADVTYDNTAFAYTSTHRKRGHVQRRTALARLTSPTQITVRLICNIDQFRAGDVVQLAADFRPADGAWLIGDCQRSVFQPYSDLTLVQTMQPINASTGGQNAPSFLIGKSASQPGAGTSVAAMISEAATINNDHYPYVWGGGHGQAGTPSGSPAGFDCSGAVTAVLVAGGLWQSGTSVPTDAGVIQQLLQENKIVPGQGTGRPECTLFDKPGFHIYMRLNGQYWGTWCGGSQTPGGGGWCSDGVAMSDFTPYHVPASILGQ